MGRPPKKLMQQENKILKPIDNEKSVSCCSTHLKIGTWSKVARHDQAIVIKIYFKKDLMAWDILGDDGVKNRIETKFSNIVALKISDMDLYKEATFQVQLKATPQIKIDEVKEARRHPKWKDWKDFTNGQASSTRLHTFTCHSLKLTKFYEKILAAKSVLTSLFNRPISSDEDLNPSQAPFGYPLNQNHNSYVDPKQFPADYQLNPNIPALQIQPTTLPVGHVANNFVGPHQLSGYNNVEGAIYSLSNSKVLDDKQEEYCDRLALPLRTLERDVCGEYLKLDGLPEFSEMEKLKFGDNAIYEIDYRGFEKVYDYDGMSPSPPPRLPQYPCRNGSDIS